MSINIIFSLEEDGAALEPPLDLGEGGYDTDNPDDVELYIRHDGTSAISNVRLYIQPYSSAYTGVEDPQTDYDDALAENPKIGHIEYSLDDGDNWSEFTEDTGDSLANSVNLGSIAADASVHLMLKFVFNSDIPDLTLGIRQFDLRLTYTFTD